MTPLQETIEWRKSQLCDIDALTEYKNGTDFNPLCIAYRETARPDWCRGCPVARRYGTPFCRDNDTSNILSTLVFNKQFILPKYRPDWLVRIRNALLAHISFLEGLRGKA